MSCIVTVQLIRVSAVCIFVLDNKENQEAITIQPFVRRTYTSSLIFDMYTQTAA